MSESQSFENQPWTNVVMSVLIMTIIGSVLYLGLSWPPSVLEWAICILFPVLSICLMIFVQRKEWAAGSVGPSMLRGPWVIMGIYSIVVAIAIMAIAFVQFRAGHFGIAVLWTVLSLISVVKGVLWMKGPLR